MLRFLLTPRWLGLLVAVLVVGGVCLQLGRWQLSRYDDRLSSNETVRANLVADPVPASEVLDESSGPTTAEQWRVVEATGTYDVDNQMFVLYRTRDRQPGVEVVVPLVTESGTALIVDRGWIRALANGNEVPAAPIPPAGEVTVTGWVRIDAEGDSSKVTESTGTMRAISSREIEESLPYDVYDGFIELTSEDPAVTPAPVQAAPPDIGSGPHFFYGLQWFFFALLALTFWFYFAWSEYKQRGAVETPSSQRPSDPTVDREHDAGDVAGRR
ncbi:MAG: SURF1 family protein [Nocardioidaceae bacterium]|nr:SURF1 family protein [Nocardioidaceae bacterium]